MKSLPASPFLQPPDAAVTQEVWTDANGHKLPDRLEHWDPFTDIEVFSSLDIDLDAVRDACALGGDSAFAVVAMWSSGRTRLSGSGAPLELGQLAGLIRIPLSLRIDGFAAGGRLRLTTSLTLRHPGTGGTPISPARDGAILWTDSSTLTLEGSAARFPVSALDFSGAQHLPDDAAWKLEWNPEALDGPVLGDLRLLINSGNDTLVSSLRSGAADTRSVATRAFVMFDVARSMVEAALAIDRFVEDPEGFEDGSIGRMLFELIAMCWPGVPFKTLATRRRDDPARLEVELQAYLQLLR